MLDEGWQAMPRAMQSLRTSLFQQIGLLYIKKIIATDKWKKMTWYHKR
jgi:hypothetical protein